MEKSNTYTEPLTIVLVQWGGELFGESDAFLSKESFKAYLIDVLERDEATVIEFLEKEYSNDEDLGIASVLYRYVPM